MTSHYGKGTIWNEMIQIELTSPTSFEKESANSRENSQEKNRLLGKHTECTKYRLVERKEILLTLQKFKPLTTPP